MGYQSIAVAVDLGDDGVVEQPIAEGDDVVAEDLAPILEGAVGWT